jgi:hypothetical protein
LAFIRLTCLPGTAVKARSIFGIIVRTVGLLLIIHALANFQAFIGMLDGLRDVGISRGALFIGFMIEMVLGLNLLFGADIIVQLSYRRPAKPFEHEPRLVRNRRRRRASEPPHRQAPDFDNLPDEDEPASN